jgi:protein O-GlcNAc transferase
MSTLGAEPSQPLDQEVSMTATKVARNDQCPCGSGKKYKQCCLQSDGQRPISPVPMSIKISDALQLAVEHHQAGRLLEADAVCQQILQMSPKHPDALHLLGMIAHQIGMHDVAETLLSDALASAPQFADGHNNLGVVLMAQGKLKEASASYQKAIFLNPTLANAHFNLGNVFKEQGKLKEAVASYQKAISLQPGYAKAHNNLGDALQLQGKLAEAVASYREALKINPDLAEVHCNLGDAYKAQGKLEESIHSNSQAITIMPGYAKAYINLAEVSHTLGRLEEAFAYARQAVLVDPDNALAYAVLGNTLMAQRLLEDAIISYRKTLSIKPEAALTYSNLLYAMQYMPTVTPAEVFSEHRLYAERHEAPHKANWPTHKNERNTERRLKIGYVSGDFFNHAVAFFIEPILANHDKSQVEVYCYYNHTQNDAHTDRMVGYADHWLVCAKLSNEQLVERIQDDGIDILVDLSGHSGNNRLPVFARKPAPVQVTWIGYPGTTGLTGMDYRITDAYLDPPGLTEQYHTEQLIRLPDTGAAYRPEPGCPPVNPLPSLASGELIFACLNNLIKINPTVIALWARLLKALPNARLMLGNVTDSGTQRRLVEEFGKEGIVAQRLILQPHMPIADYLALHHKIDLALDPFPYNGGTTTLHSLWMGVPVVTLAGGHTVSRVGVAAMSRVGLDQFITHSEEEYLQRAIALVQDLPGLNRIRQGLRDRMGSANCEPAAITRHLEAAYRDMWRKWCAA